MDASERPKSREYRIQRDGMAIILRA
jgi:hypothetical protein